MDAGDDVAFLVDDGPPAPRRGIVPKFSIPPGPIDDPGDAVVRRVGRGSSQGPVAQGPAPSEGIPLLS